MSRHRLVKTMDLDDELDDFDGGEYDYDEGAAGEEGTGPPKSVELCCSLMLLLTQSLSRTKSRGQRCCIHMSISIRVTWVLVTDDVSFDRVEQMREGTLKVRDVLGPDIAVTDKEIQDSLWHYYYDIAKTVTYLLSTLIPQEML